MKRLMLLLIAVALLAIPSAAQEAKWTPLMFQIGDQLTALGINTLSPSDLPIAQLDRGDIKAWQLQQYICFPNTPVHNQDKVYFRPTKGRHLDTGKINSTEENNALYQVGFRDILKWSVRRVDMWASYDSSPCINGEWIGSGTTFFPKEVYNLSDNFEAEIWLTADHITNLGPYIGRPDVKIVQVAIDGTVPALILPRHPGSEFAVLLVRDTPDTIPMDWWTKYTPDGIFPDDDWKVGDLILSPFFTLTYYCIPKDWTDLYANCIGETAQVNLGNISTQLPIPSEIGADIIIQSNLVGGSSGSPYLLFRSNGDIGYNLADFRLLAIENIG